MIGRKAAEIRLLNREYELGGALKRFARSDYRRGELRVIDRIRIMLGLEAKAMLVSRVELNARLVGSHFHESTALRFVNTGGHD